MQFDKNIYHSKELDKIIDSQASIIQTIVKTILFGFIVIVIGAVIAVCLWASVENKRIALERISGNEVTWWDAYWVSGR